MNGNPNFPERLLAISKTPAKSPVSFRAPRCRVGGQDRTVCEQRVFPSGVTPTPMAAIRLTRISLQETVFDGGLWDSDPTLLDKHLYTETTVAIMSRSAVSPVTATLTIALP